MTEAVFHGEVVMRKRPSRIVRRKPVRGTEDVDLPRGDGKSGVTSTRGFKHWYSSRDAGISVESTISVTIPCNNNTPSIESASDYASEIALRMSEKGIEEMDEYVEDFMKEIE